ncbi:MAG: hypothetical protein WAN05_28235, partial [Roseiarcus sp.]
LGARSDVRTDGTPTPNRASGVRAVVKLAASAFLFANPAVHFSLPHGLRAAICRRATFLDMQPLDCQLL